MYVLHAPSSLCVRVRVGVHVGVHVYACLYVKAAKKLWPNQIVQPRMVFIMGNPVQSINTFSCD